MTLKFGSVCSGIEAASMAWNPLGWRASFVSEIEPFPRAVLAQRHPDTPLHGDFTTIREGEYEPIDILAGGTPCQAFSIAGQRRGMDDPRGELSLEYVALAKRLRPRWLVWENVPGVMSSNGGRDFGAFLRALVECGYGFAYRVLDAQYFGLAQRRKRVILVGHIGGCWQRAAAVLFEPEGMRWDPAQESSPDVSNCITSNALRSYVKSETLIAEGSGEPFRIRSFSPVECERLMGFPDNYTRIPYRGRSAENCPDGPRYAALGNSWAVPKFAWIGRRIAQVDALEIVQ